MITKTSLNHPKVRREVIRATINVIRGYSVDHVRNSKGRAFIAIRAVPADNKCGSVLYAVDKNGRDVTEAVSAVIKEYIRQKREKV